MEGRRDTSITGSIGEYFVIGEFLNRGFDVYLPVVDRGIDCVVSNGSDYYEMQVKTRTSVKGGKYVFDVRNFKVRNNFFIVCYQVGLFPNDFWIIPSKIFHEYGYQTSKGNVHRLVLNPKKQKLLEEYKNNFNQLRNGE